MYTHKNYLCIQFCIFLPSFPCSRFFHITSIVFRVAFVCFLFKFKWEYITDPQLVKVVNIKKHHGITMK